MINKDMIHYKHTKKPHKQHMIEPTKPKIRADIVTGMENDYACLIHCFGLYLDATTTKCSYHNINS